MCRLYYGIPRQQVCKVAFEVAERNKLQHSFDKEKGTASKDWFRGFMLRNPEISILVPESTSIARVYGFGKSEVELFYKNLGEVVEKNKFESSRIFSMDETELSTI
jgi:hypothetical protein